MRDKTYLSTRFPSIKQKEIKNRRLYNKIKHTRLVSFWVGDPFEYEETVDPNQDPWYKK